MIQRDYIMRMIEQLAIVLKKILHLKQEGKIDEAETEISNIGKTLLGLDIDFLNKFNTAGIIDFLTRSNSFDTGKCIIIAELLKEKGELHDIRKELNESYQCYQKSLDLYLEVLNKFTEYRQNDFFKKITFLTDKLIEYEMPARLQYKLMQYYEMIGDYAEAENILFHLIDNGGIEIVKEGLQFYNRLLAKTDDELKKGNLPRNEIEEGLLALKKKTA
jgi:tetratricopeptide (TPR) repeat protein